MRVAIVVPSLLPTGPVRVALDHAQGLRDRGHFVQLFYFDAKPGAATDPFAQPIKFFKSIDLRNFDVVHTHGLRPDAWLWWHRPSQPTFTTLHNYAAIDLGYLYPKTIAKTAAWAWKFFTQHHTVRLVLSHHMKTYYEQKGWKPPILVLPNSRPAPEKLPPIAIQNQLRDYAANHVLLGNISHVTPRKGLEQVIDLMCINPSYKFAHIGSGTEALQAYAAKKGVADRCLWLGPQPAAAQFLPLFDVFVMPSYSEGFPLALLEAVAAKVPAVVSNLPVFAEVFPDAAVARFPLGDIPKLDAAIKQVCAEKTDRTAKAYTHYLQHYEPQVVAEKLEALYKAFI